MASTLGFEREDGVEIVYAVERAFDIKISDIEASAVLNVGDFYDLLAAKVPHFERSDDLPCLTASVFRKLRHATTRQCPNLEILPNTRVNSIVPLLSRRAFGRYLSEQTGLDVSRLTVPNAVVGVSYFALVVVIGTLLASVPNTRTAFELIVLPPLLGVVALIPVIKFSPIRSWPDGMTFGDLSRETAAWTIGASVRRHGAVRSRELWHALIYHVGRFSSEKDIQRETTFFARTGAV